MHLRLLLVASALPSAAFSQGNVWKHDSIVVNRSANPMLSSFRFRSIGPASMGGRIDDIAVADRNPNIIYLGYATGGVFRSVNNGTTFEPVFERYGSASVGDIAIDPANADVVYVGTGEPNNRQTSSFGDGIYKSVDGGKTFANVGLRETQTIARVVIDPKHSDIVYVAAPGHLFGPSPDRGVYKTTDGGKTWKKVKYVDENTGFTDIAIDASNPNVLYAASYQRRRTGCCYNGGGAGSALWKTEDAGKNWTRLSNNGLPAGTYGRIAIDVSRSKPNVVYAQIEADGGETPPPASPAVGGAVTGGRGGYDWCNNAGPGRGFGAGRGGGAGSDTARVPPMLDVARSGVFRSDDRGRSWKAVSNCNARPLYFSQLRVDPANEQRVYVGGLRVSKSQDGGKTFITLDRGTGFSNETEDNHALWIDPRNSDHLLRGSDAGLAVSWDQGETWEYNHIMATALAYWVSADMGHPYHVFAGFQDNDSWGGPSATRGRIGIRSHDWYHLSGGDGFQTAADPAELGVIYSESQDGSVVRTDVRTGRQQSVRPVAPAAGRGGAGRGTAANDSVRAVPGDSEAPGCSDGRITAPGAAGRGGGGGGGGGGRGGGTPNVVNARPGDTYRFNWNTPLMLSPHNPHIVWVGGNRLFKSYDQGNTWLASADLTRQVDRCTVEVMGVAGTKAQLAKNDGVSAYSTIIAIAESPVMPDVVWAGTDDGNLQVKRAGEDTFTEVQKNLPGLPAGAFSGASPYWISRIEASHVEPGGAFVAVDGHRSDDLHPYLFVTRDYGRTFSSISSDLPPYGNVQVIRQDPKNANLLFAGTEFGLFVSMNGGAHWEPFMTGYPTVRTDDILVHPRDGDLIVASHGRSLWIADDITPLEQLTPAVVQQDVMLFDVRPAISYAFDYRADPFAGSDKAFEGENPAKGTAIQYYLKSAVPDSVKVAIVDVNGRTLCTSNGPSTAGIHRLQWTLVAPLAAGGRGGRAGTPPGEATAAPGNPATDASCSGGAGGGRGGGAAAAAAPGSYVVRLTVGARVLTKVVEVLEDKWLHER